MRIKKEKEAKEVETQATLPSINLPTINPNVPKEALTENDKEYLLQTSKFTVRVLKEQEVQNTIIFENGDRKAVVRFYTSKTMQASKVENNEQALLFSNILGNDELLLEVKGQDVRMAFKMKEGFQGKAYPMEIGVEHLIMLENYEENMLVFRDERTNEDVFIFDHGFVKDNENHIMNQIEMQHRKERENIYLVKVFLPTKWMELEEQTYPFTLEASFNANDGIDDMIFMMNINEKGEGRSSVNGKCILGYIQDRAFRVVILVNAIKIVQNILQNQLENYRVNLLLPYEEGERYQSTTGFVMYHNDEIVVKSLLQDENHMLKIDITTYIQKEVQKYQQNQEVSTIQFTMFHDYDLLSSIEDKQFTGEDYVEICTESVSSNFQRPTIELKEGIEYEEKRSYSLLEGGTTSISLNTKEVSHVIPLGEIKEGNITIPIELQYRDNYRKRQETKEIPTHLGKGWYLNVEQRIQKEKVFLRKASGMKITYYDGEQNKHEFIEKWYYKEGSIKKYVAKNEVFFSMEGKLSYQDKEGKTHEVYYEAESKEGLTYISKSSIYSYPQKSALKLKEHYYVRLCDGNLFEVFKNENGQLLIPVAKKAFQKLSENRGKVHEEFSFLLSDHNYCPDVSGFYDVAMPDEFSYQNGNFIWSNAEIKEVVYKEFPLLLRNGKHSIPKLKRVNVIFVSEKNDEEGKEEIDRNDEYEEYENEMEIIYQPTYEFQNILSDEELMTENMSEIIEQLKTYEEQILVYKTQIDSLSSSLVERKKMADYYRILYLASFKKGYQDYLTKVSTESEYGGELCKSRVEESQNSYKEALKSLINYEKALIQLEYNYQMLKEKKLVMLKEGKDDVKDIILDQDGNILGFDRKGRLILIENAKEERIVFEYDGDDLLSIQGEKEKIRFFYNENHEMSKMRDTLGRVICFYYFNGTLLSCKLKKENNSVHEIQFTYANGKLDSVKDDSGMIQSLTYGLTSVIITQKTTTKKISKTGTESLVEPKIILQEKIESISNNAPCTITNLLTTQKLIYRFGDEGKTLRVSLQSPSMDEDKSVGVFHYDNKNRLRFEVNYEANQLIQSIIHANTDIVAEKTMTYGIGNKSNDVIKAYNLPTFGTFFFAFDFKQSLAGILSTFIIKITDKEGNIREYQEVFEGNETEHMGVPFGLRNTDTSLQINLHFSKPIDFSWLKDLRLYLANANVYEYDENNHLIKKVSGVEEIHYEEWSNNVAKKVTHVDGYGNSTFVRYTMNSMNQLLHQVDEKGNEISYVYDEEGRLVEERSYHQSSPLEARVKRYSYDENSQRQFVSNGRRINQKEVYQEMMTSPRTNLLRYICSSRGVKTNYGYDFHTGELTQISVDVEGEKNSTSMSYRFGLLTSLEHHGMNILYNYDGSGRVIKRTVVGGFNVTTTYEDPSLSPDPIYPDKNRITSKVTTLYSNNYKVEATYDEDGKVIQVKKGANEVIDYSYNRDGTLSEINGLGEIISYSYFKKTSNVESQAIISSTYYSKITNTLDELGRIKTRNLELANMSSLHTYSYNTEHQLVRDVVQHSNLKNEKSVKHTTGVSYDALGRIKEKVLYEENKLLCKQEYKYLQNDDCTFDLVTLHKVIISNKETIETQYTYDEENQITTMQKGNQKIRYQYDELNRLVREDNSELNKTMIYQYDEGGNLKVVKTYSYTLSEDLSNPLEEHQFAYGTGWKDQLVRVDDEVITYDTMGRMKQIGDDVLTRNEKGQLTSYKDTSFTYDVRGLRRTKGNTTYYYDDNGRILGEKGTRTINGVNREIEIIYTYGMDKITGFVYNGNGYFYLRNIQGDILSIYKCEDSSLVASYQYDAWGNQTVTNYGEEEIGNINPIRYRGYYYDEETGLYYLNSRYYDSKLRRFICPDTLSILDETMSEINGLNLYMYCKDNPVMYVDPSGCLAMPFWFVLSIAGVVTTIFEKDAVKIFINMLTTLVSVAEIVAGVLLILSGAGLKWGIGVLGIGIGSIVNGYITMSNGGSYLAGWAGGQIAGILTFIPYYGGAIGTFVGSVFTDLIDSNFDFNQVDWGKAGACAGIAFALSAFGSVVSWDASHSELKIGIAAEFILSYNYALLGICNTIINVFFRGGNE